MATYTAATYAFDLSVTANYQALMGDIDSKIQSLGGWTYVSQTGDGNPASTSPGSNNTYPCFRVYSTTVGSTTWYVRIDFGHNSGPSLKMQCGTSVNGSGTLGGQTCTQVTQAASNTSTGQSLHVSAAAGRLMVFFGLAVNSRGAQAAFSLHGNVDGSGTMVSGMEIVSGSNTAGTAQYVPASGSVPAQVTVWPVPGCNAASYAVGGAIPLFPPQFWDSTGGNNPSMVGFGYGSSDLTTNTTTTVNLYGSTHSYIVSPLTGGTQMNTAWRYE